jgi:hypothetical protein
MLRWMLSRWYQMVDLGGTSTFEGIDRDGLSGGTSRGYEEADRREASDPAADRQQTYLALDVPQTTWELQIGLCESGLITVGIFDWERGETILVTNLNLS